VDTATSQRKKAEYDDLSKRLYRRFKVQLEEDGAGSTGQSWMETSGL